MVLPDIPARLCLHDVSMHLLGAKTSWQNVQDEAIGGGEAAHQVVQDFQEHRTVSVHSLRAYLAYVAGRQHAWVAIS